MPFPLDPFHDERSYSERKVEKSAPVPISNIIENLPPEITAQGKEAEDVYIETLKKSKKLDTYCEVKVILVGNDKEQTLQVENRLRELNQKNKALYNFLDNEALEIGSFATTCVPAIITLNPDYDKTLKSIIQENKIPENIFEKFKELKKNQIDSYNSVRIKKIAPSIANFEINNTYRFEPFYPIAHKKTKNSEADLMLRTHGLDMDYFKRLADEYGAKRMGNIWHVYTREELFAIFYEVLEHVMSHRSHDLDIDYIKRLTDETGVKRIGIIWHEYNGKELFGVFYDVLEQLVSHPNFNSSHSDFSASNSTEQSDISKYPLDYYAFFVNRHQNLIENYLIVTWNYNNLKIYKNIQKLFFTNRTIYILLYAPNESLKDIYAKIEQIQQVGINSPIILVIQAGDWNKINLEELHKNFPNIDNVLVSDDISSIYDLRKKIEELLTNGSDLDKILSSRFPKTWLDLKYELNFLRETSPYIQQFEFFELCERYNIIESEEQEILLTTLHHLGVVIHFDDDQSLVDFIFLDYQWINEAIEALVNDNTVQSNNGYFNQEDLKRIWSEKKLKLHLGKLLSIVTKKSLNFCYKLDNNNYLIYDLIPFQIPISFIPQISDLRIKLYFEKFLHLDIFYYLLARIFTSFSEPKFGKNGIVVKNEKFELVFFINFELNSIEVCIQCKDMNKKIEIMGVVNSIIDKIQNQFTRFTITRKAPCHCNTCLSSDNRHEFDLIMLEKRMAGKKSHTIECPVSGDDIQLRDLIGVIDFDIIDDVNTLIKNNDLTDAIELLEYKHPNNVELIGLSSRLNELERQDISDTLSRDNYTVERNKIIKSLLKLSQLLQ